jgi:uncharacterized OB-fold protein
MGQQLAMVEYLVLDDGPPHLVANACAECGALYFDRRNACAKCGKTTFAKRSLDTAGRVRAFTIVQRAAPGVPCPYVSAIIDLNGGGVVKANLVDVSPDPASITLDMPVRLTTFVAGADGQGTEAIAFGFAPTGKE